jgi:hypothetical protein
MLPGPAAAGQARDREEYAEKRNSGVMTNRNSALKLPPFFSVPANAMMGALKASPVSTAAGIAASTSGVLATPNSHITPVNTIRHGKQTQRHPCQFADHDVDDAHRRAGDGLVVTIHSNFPLIGKLDSKVAVCMQVAARRPGARKAR